LIERSKKDIASWFTMIKSSQPRYIKMRIQLTRPTVKTLEALLQKMVKLKEVKLGRRISALLEHLHQQVKVEVVAQKWGVSQAAI
jgi:hypothetical protein